MIVLDTNILSELIQPKGSQLIKAWAKSQPRDQLFITSITQSEILYGIAILPTGKRKQLLHQAASTMFQAAFPGKILPFDRTAANYYATITSYRRSKGRPISQSDAQIAAICCSHQATLATRNVKDFIDCSLDIINPWEP